MRQGGFFNKDEPIAFPQNLSATQCASEVNLAPAMGSKNPTAIAGRKHKQKMAVRRLTPKECEFLQGFTGNYLDIIFNKNQAKDGPKYRALGNSMAVPVMIWIGKQIETAYEK